MSTLLARRSRWAKTAVASMATVKAARPRLSRRASSPKRPSIPTRNWLERNTGANQIRCRRISFSTAVGHRKCRSATPPGRQSAPMKTTPPTRGVTDRNPADRIAGKEAFPSPLIRIRPASRQVITYGVVSRIVCSNASRVWRSRSSVTRRIRSPRWTSRASMRRDRITRANRTSSPSAGTKGTRFRFERAVPPASIQFAGRPSQPKDWKR